MLGARRLGLALTIVFAAGVSQAAAREWRDATGNFRVEAELVTVTNGKAYLEKTDGKVVPVPLNRLSAADLAYLQSLPEYKQYFTAHPVTAASPAPVKPTTVKPAASPVAAALPTRKFATIRVEDPNKVGEIRRSGNLGWGIESLAFSPDGGMLLFGKSDDAIGILEVDTMQPLGGVTNLEKLGNVTVVAFSPDGTKILAGGGDGRIEVWKSGERGLFQPCCRFVNHPEEITAATISADSTHVLSADSDGKVCYWDLATGREAFSISGFEKNYLKSTYITRSGKQGLACDGKSLALIDLVEGKVLQKMVLENSYSQTSAIAPDGSRLVVSRGSEMRQWDIRTGQQTAPMKDRDSHQTIVFMPNSRYLLSGGSGIVSVWEVATSRKLYEFDLSEKYSSCKSIAPSPDGRHFAIAAASTGPGIQVFRLPAELAQ